MELTKEQFEIIIDNAIMQLKLSKAKPKNKVAYLDSYITNFLINSLSKNDKDYLLKNSISYFGERNIFNIAWCNDVDTIQICISYKYNCTEKYNEFIDVGKFISFNEDGMIISNEEFIGSEDYYAGRIVSK